MLSPLKLWTGNSPGIYTNQQILHRKPCTEDTGELLSHSDGFFPFLKEFWKNRKVTFMVPI
jgi:hypothetical protein